MSALLRLSTISRKDRATLGCPGGPHFGLVLKISQCDIMDASIDA
jgi:hypothetical protein